MHCVYLPFCYCRNVCFKIGMLGDPFRPSSVFFMVVHFLLFGTGSQIVQVYNIVKITSSVTLSEQFLSMENVPTFSKLSFHVSHP